MGNVIFDISMSLDGFIAASGMTPDVGMGEGGEALHDWAFAGDERDRFRARPRLRGEPRHARARARRRGLLVRQ